MIDKQQDFLTLTGAARRARSEGYDITYHSLRNLVAAGYISHVPNGSRIYIFYPNLVNFIQNGLTAEQSLDYQLSRARNCLTFRPQYPPMLRAFFEAGGSNLCSVKIAVIKSQIPLNSALPAVIPLAQRHPPVQ